MAYVVLARKLRPQRFSDLIGQEISTRILQNAIRQDRVAHAFLFTGSRGTGKTSAARILTRALNCLTPQDADPCGSCENCREIESGAAPDVYEIDAASNRGIENIRELRENVNYAPARCRFKVYIIDEAHMLTLESFNALLKTLEEPPPHVKFILATTDPHKVPQTILSRCQRYDFLRIPVRTMVDYLRQVVSQEGITLPESALELIARNSVGGMRDALTAIDQVLSSLGEEASDEETAQLLGVLDSHSRMRLLEALTAKDAPAAMRCFQELHDSGHDTQTLLQNLLESVKTCALIQTLGPDRELFQEYSNDELETFAALGKQVSPDELQQMFQVLLELEERLKRSTHVRICFEMAILQLTSVVPLVGIPELLEQLRGLPTGEVAAPPSPPSGNTGGSSSSGGTGTAPPYHRKAGRITSMLKQEERKPAESAPVKPPETPGMTKMESPKPEPPSMAKVPPSSAPELSAAHLNGHAPEPEVVAELAPSLSVPENPVELAGTMERQPPSERWVQFVQSLRQHAPKLAGLVRNAIPDELGGQELRLGFRNVGFVQMLTAENMSELARLLKKFLGREVGVHCLQEPQVSLFRTVLEQEEFVEQQERERRRQAAREHPLIQNILATFPGSEITEIRLH